MFSFFKKKLIKPKEPKADPTPQEPTVEPVEPIQQETKIEPTSQKTEQETKIELVQQKQPVLEEPKVAAEVAPIAPLEDGSSATLLEAPHDAPHDAPQPVAQDNSLDEQRTETATTAPEEPAEKLTPAATKEASSSWLQRLKKGLSKTSSNISTIFSSRKVDEELFEELEEALLLADTGVKATQHLIDDLRQRVKSAHVKEADEVKALLVDAFTELLMPLEKTLVIEPAQDEPMVMMVVGVNGAGKTTSIGKLTHHLSEADAGVLLAAADTFRAAAREQLDVWATRNTVDIIGLQGGDPAAVSYDAVSAGKARGKDVVIVDTAGRLPTQLHLMDELKKIHRVIGKAQPSAPHEVLLVIDGNTGQNALAQVKAFDDALKLTGLIVTKLDGTAKGGVLAAIAQERPIPVYFVGVGEKLEDLQAFNAREFAQALLD